MVNDAVSLSSGEQLSARLSAGLSEREAKGLARELRVREVDRELLDLANNDYLRLSQHPQVKAAAIAATEKWGCSSSASPLVTGFTTAHAELLKKLQAWYRMRSGMLWNTGYAANQAVLSHLPQRGDIVLADRLIHHSMISGLLASGARLQRYRHLDLTHLEALLEDAAGKGTVFVVTETVFSMDGDAPDLQAMAKLKSRYGFVWIVDEAHAVGWYGRTGSGMVEAAGVLDAVDVIVGTLGKGLGSMGAFTLFNDDVLRRHLVNHAGEFIYSTYLAPSCAAAASAAIDMLQAKSGRCDELHKLSRAFREQVKTAPTGDSPIVPVAVGDPVAAAAKLRASGIIVGAIRPPTVPVGQSRLRVSLNANLSDAELSRVASAINNVASEGAR